MTSFPCRRALRPKARAPFRYRPICASSAPKRFDLVPGSSGLRACRPRPQSVPGISRPSIEHRLRCVMRLSADCCKALRHRTGASGSVRVGHSGPGDFIRCESRHTDPLGACSWLCERTQPVRCRSLNAAARSLPHCRHRHRRSRWSIRTFPTVSRWPLPQWSGIWTRAILRRRSARENGMTSVLLVAIAPPLPRSYFHFNSGTCE